jgi:hypothetical protein
MILKDPSPTLGLSRLSFWMGWGTAGALMDSIYNQSTIAAFACAFFAVVQLHVYRNVKRVINEKENEDGN